VTSAAIVARRIAPVVWAPFAARAYLDRFGSPKTPDELSRHNCLVHQTVSPHRCWRFHDGAREYSVAVGGTFSSNSVLMLKEVTEAGIGIGLLPSFAAGPSLESRDLVRVLPRFAGQSRDLYIAYEARTLPRCTRLLIDYLTDELGSLAWTKQAA
jgi:DNA-binding transcriptional LysR family regulator